MLIESNEAQEIVNRAWGVIAALTPAFAAGFGIQRLMEIVDSLVELNSRISKTRQRAILSVASFLAGLGVAAGLDIRVFATLTAQLGVQSILPKGIDLIVTALIISGGTEGFNSILKFLSYSKENKNQEAQIKTEVAEQERFSIVSNRNLSSLFSKALTGLGVTSGLNTGDILLDVEKSLHDTMQKAFRDQFIEAEWKKLAFSKYIDDVGKAQITVVKATEDVGYAYGGRIPSNILKNLQRNITLDTVPGDALFELMSIAVEERLPFGQ